MGDLQVAGINVSRETYDKLRAFEALTAKWTRKINLISASTTNDIWRRHITDSAQIFPHAPEAASTWVDLGSGGGFPGIVLAILAAEHRPVIRLTLVESDQRKATFLRTAVRELGLGTKITPDRIENIPPQLADVVSARALAPLSGLLGMVSRHLADGGTALLPKGKQTRQELAEARKNWRFELEDRPSITDPEARILAFQRIQALGH